MGYAAISAEQRCRLKPAPSVGVQDSRSAFAHDVVKIAIIPAQTTRVSFRSWLILTGEIRRYFAAEFRMAIGADFISQSRAPDQHPQVRYSRNRHKSECRCRLGKFDPSGARRSCNVGSFVASGKAGASQVHAAYGGAAVDQKYSSLPAAISLNHDLVDHDMAALRLACRERGDRGP